MPVSADVSPGDTVLASQYNAVRDDVFDTSTGHGHTGVTDEGQLITLRDAVANRPSAVAGNTGKLFKATDTGAEDVTRSSGSAWETVAPVNPAVGIGGFRTLGTGALQAAAGDHGHSFSEDVSGFNTDTGSDDGALDVRRELIPASSTKSASTTLNTNVLTRVVACGTFENVVSTVNTKAEIKINGVIITTDTTPNIAYIQVRGSSEETSGARLIEFLLSNDQGAASWGVSRRHGVQGIAVRI